MKLTSIFLIICASLAVVPNALAQEKCINKQIGNFGFLSCDNGIKGTTKQIGPFNFGNFNDGTKITQKRIGSFDFIDIDRQGNNLQQNDALPLLAPSLQSQPMPGSKRTYPRSYYPGMGSR